MTESNQTSAVPLSVSKKKKKAKNFYEHGKDALGLALLVADMQEEKALRKTEKHHQPQAGKSSRAGRSDRDRPNDGRKRLEEAKVTIAKRRARAKKEKARSRKESRRRLQERHDAKMTAPEDITTSAAPRKRVSFA